MISGRYGLNAMVLIRVWHTSVNILVVYGD
jgi:hypothetical protein